MSTAAFVTQAAIFMGVGFITGLAVANLIVTIIQRKMKP
jgi:hypothetical protein